VSSSEGPWLEIVERVDGLPRTRYEGDAYRHQGPGYQPLNTEGARIFGGRWNPPESFPVLYLALTPAVAAAELRRFADKSARPIEDLLPRLLHAYHVRLGAVIDVTEPAALMALDLKEEALISDDVSLSRRIGETAHYVGFEAIMARSATGAGVTLSVFFDTLRANSEIRPVGSTMWESVEDLRD
jgi:RES domain-containing protein